MQGYRHAIGLSVWILSIDVVINGLRARYVGFQKK